MCEAIERKLKNHANEIAKLYELLDRLRFDFDMMERAIFQVYEHLGISSMYFEEWKRGQAEITREHQHHLEDMIARRSELIRKREAAEERCKWFTPEANPSAEGGS